MDINILELKEIYFCLQSLCDNVRDTHLKILTGKITAVHSVNNMDSCKSLSCNWEVRNILRWAIMRNNFITAAHIPGIINVEADAESRSSETRTYWKLNESYIHSLLNHFRSIASDHVFVWRINTQTSNIDQIQMLTLSMHLL